LHCSTGFDTPNRGPTQSPWRHHGCIL